MDLEPNRRQDKEEILDKSYEKERKREREKERKISV